MVLIAVDNIVRCIHYLLDRLFPTILPFLISIRIIYYKVKALSSAALSSMAIVRYAIHYAFFKAYIFNSIEVFALHILF